jgi:hypothetical protein
MLNANSQYQEFLKRNPKPSVESAIQELESILKWRFKEHLIFGYTETPYINYNGCDYHVNRHLRSDLNGIVSSIIKADKKIVIYKLTPIIFIEPSTVTDITSIADARAIHTFHLHYLEIE